MEPLFQLTTPQHSCGERGGPLERTPSCCDFCGSSEHLQEYLVCDETTQWYACAGCAQLIDTDNWELLTERTLVAYTDTRWTPGGEKPVVRKQVDLVSAFRGFRLVSA